MKAVIYAAGRGERLGPSFAGTPKVLLELGGRTLLERHAENLAAAGVTSLVVVTGHLRAKVAGAIEALLPRSPPEVCEVFNPRFREGSILSLRASVPELRAAGGPALLLDGDVLYPRVFIERLVHSVHPTALLIDRAYSAEDDDPVLVPVRNGRPFDLRKKWSGDADAVGESIGFFKLSADDLPELIRETERRSEESPAREPYEEALRALVAAGRFGSEDVTGLPWIEIDFPGDLERAARETLPAIESLEKASGS